MAGRPLNGLLEEKKTEKPGGSSMIRVQRPMGLDKDIALAAVERG